MSIHTKSVLDFTAFVTGALSLLVGLIEQARDHPAKARKFDACGQEVNKALRRLTISNVVYDEELQPLIDAYEKALEQCGDNHDDIDEEIARVRQDIEDARDEERHWLLLGQMNGVEMAKKARVAAQQKLKRAKWRERFHLYWLYVSTLAVPAGIGLILLLFGR